ncbi:putative DNA helicase INO80 [Acetobacter orientalis]|uniref:Putative DNA helicase INO80 n=1 Tax=Acetobacter orientalis TaxID=146474 RepID=A0A2Z5ZJZ6_9PROT|nr:putative DNA helicase INO80 [Acetobacter orientalis]
MVHTPVQATHCTTHQVRACFTPRTRPSQPGSFPQWGYRELAPYRQHTRL